MKEKYSESEQTAIFWTLYRYRNGDRNGSFTAFSVTENEHIRQRWKEYEK